jgi:DNA modification methylase
LQTRFPAQGSTIAAAKAVGLSAIGAERHLDYFEMSVEAIPRLAALKAEAPTFSRMMKWAKKHSATPK